MLLAILTLVTPLQVAANVVFVCQMSGKRGPSCCCQRARAKANARAGFERAVRGLDELPKLKRKGCCTLESDASEERSKAVVSPTWQLLPLAAQISGFAFEEAWPEAHAVSVSGGRSRAPPPARIPLFIRHRSLLI